MVSLTETTQPKITFRKWQTNLRFYKLKIDRSEKRNELLCNLGISIAHQYNGQKIQMSDPLLISKELNLVKSSLALMSYLEGRIFEYPH